ncbi:AAA family ATPase [Anaerotignum sp.]|uniref:AAA family ATPase n=1 Tax=Anaerotignum sp. TaxID=2039241 RepID=UPI00271516D3|nr:AAA family ATPase [Anaerotignum sp.]
MTRLYIEALRLVGKKNSYVVTFKQGLNYISGPTSTGKTSILEMIDYALGSDSHKSYIEIGESCTDVELEIQIESKKYRITRKLFEFMLPIRVDEWNQETETYKYLDTFEFDVPSNEKSLSSFLINKLGLGNIKIMNQNLSFRDIFKFSYLKQTEVDTEDLMGESIWFKNNKRKSTFEIIFNVYDDMLAELKATLKEKTVEKDNFKLQLEGVEKFISTTDIGNIATYRSKKNEIKDRILSLNDELTRVKNDKVIGNETTRLLRNEVVKLKQELKAFIEQKLDQDEYIEKLRLLLNQYQNDVDKCKMILLGVPEINKYNFIVCPNCLKTLKERNEETHCKLCGSDMSSEISDLLQVKKDMSSLKSRHTELKKHISVEQAKSDTFDRKISEKNKELAEKEGELEHLQQGYINPYIEKIEYLNFEMGKFNRQLHELDFNLQMLEEHERLLKLLKNKEDDLSSIRKNIGKISTDQNDKNEVTKELSTVFNNYLKAFHFPKLDFGYIDSKTYLPYVRGRKYNDLGSLGGVTLIVIAYYLAILNVTLDTDKYYHLNLLMIDSPRKNLGADVSQEEFRDEEIFNSVIKTFIEFEQELGESMQLIVVNNGYPDFVPKDDIRVEFDPNGRIGLIDDALH